MRNLFLFLLNCIGTLVYIVLRIIAIPLMFAKAIGLFILHLFVIPFIFHRGAMLGLIVGFLLFSSGGAYILCMYAGIIVEIIILCSFRKDILGMFVDSFNFGWDVSNFNISTFVRSSWSKKRKVKKSAPARACGVTVQKTVTEEYCYEE